MHPFIQIMTELLYPRRCPLCDGILGRAEPLLCRDCGRKLRFAKEPRCFRCGRPLEREEQGSQDGVGEFLRSLAEEDL